MSTIKVIENPEVPGLECFLPPPPPPPPPPPVITSSNDRGTEPENKASSRAETTRTTVSAPLTNSTSTVQAPTTPFQSMTAPIAYVIHPGLQGQTPTTPWWIPTDEDTADLYPQWYETSFKAAALLTPQAQHVAAKIKNKQAKRKIDPAQDAEKVASAQRELSAMMKPLKCELCTAVMNSTLQAKRHYEGKPHRKKVSMFLNQSVKKKPEDGQVSSTTTTDWQNYCDICKTWFTSQIDATQHYAGRKHIRAANGGPIAKASKKSLGQSQYNQVDPTGRFGIGAAFQPELQSATTTITAATTTTTTTTTTTISPDPATTLPVYTPSPYPTPLRCDLCGVSANRQDQLEMHKRGARHLRMLRLNGLPIPEPETECAPATPGPIDYSIYRTPSGQYYCAPCNLSLNSESTFGQHMESKKHKSQSNPKPCASNGATIPKRPRLEKK